MSYTQVFGGTTIYPSDVSYLAISLTADKALEWPLESNDPANPAARVIDVTALGSYSITLPDATQTGAGQTILFNNLSASATSFTVKSYGGATIATIAVGEQWQVYLADTSTAAGVWRVFRYGASTATVQASALAGYGLTVTSGTLSQSQPVTTFTSNRSVIATDRAATFVWNGTGAGTLSLISAATVGNNFFIGVRNNGGGDLTVAAAGSETVDGLSTLSLRPGDSATLVTDGLTWYTIGLGQEAVFAFDYTSISVSGGTYTLAASELNRIAYKFVGALSSDQYVVVPSTVQQYWVDNSTTGSYSFYLQTSGGTPVAIAQGARGIYYCNGTNVVDADTGVLSLPVNVLDGGTGITNYATGDLLYASGPSTLSKLSDVATGNALLSGGVGAAPAWGKIDLTTHVSGVLPIAEGGTNASTAAAARTSLGVPGLSVGNTFTAPQVISVNSASDGLRITQTGSGNALVVEDSANPDATPFVIDGGGVVLHGATTAVTGVLYDGTAATPTTQQHGVGGNNTTLWAANWGNSAVGASLALGKARGGTIGTPNIVFNNDVIGAINFAAADGTNFVNAALITGEVDGAPGTNDMPGRLKFWTTPDGSATPVERAQIDNKGNVTIGTAAVATTATDGFLYIPTCAGTPTGVPTTKTGLAPMVVDSTNNKLYVYIGGAWRAMN